VERKDLLPPTYLSIGLAAMALFHFALSGPRLIGAPWRFAGVIPVAAGVWLNLWADSLFKRHGTEVKPFRESAQVVSDGPFRFSRHPMYTGFVAILAGCAMLAGTLVPFVILLVMTWLFTVRFVIPEEAHMEEQFGKEYRDYEARVRRWL
jgi:protein-S-isoprenylcysteine O-methyltransferase Ste14